MNTILRLSIIFILCGFATSCNNEAAKIESTPVKINRLDKKIATYNQLDSTQQSEMLRTDSIALAAFGQAVGDSVCDGALRFWAVWPPTVMFQPEVDRIFPDLDREEDALGYILAVAKAEGIPVHVNNFVAVTWGIRKSIGFSDSTMMIALNHYLGPLNEAYNGWPEYERRLKTRDMLPVDMAEALVATAYPYEPTDGGSVLSRLLYEGALVEAKARMVPSASKAAVLGLAPESIADVEAHEAYMWKHLVENGMLYSKDAEVIDNLFSPRPNSSMLSPDAPGRAARLIGYQIVKSYLARNPEAKLSDILSPKFYANPQQTLRESGYEAK